MEFIYPPRVNSTFHLVCGGTHAHASEMNKSWGIVYRHSLMFFFLIFSPFQMREIERSFMTIICTNASCTIFKTENCLHMCIFIMKSYACLATHNSRFRLLPFLQREAAARFLVCCYVLLLFFFVSSMKFQEKKIPSSISTTFFLTLFPHFAR